MGGDGTGSVDGSRRFVVGRQNRYLLFYNVARLLFIVRIVNVVNYEEPKQRRRSEFLKTDLTTGLEPNFMWQSTAKTIRETRNFWLSIACRNASIYNDR